MQVIKFIVLEDKIRIDPECKIEDISKIWHKNMDISAEFSFSKEWNDVVKVAKFTRGDIEFTPKVLDHGTTCIIPHDAMNGKFFRLCIIGRSLEKELQTNTIIVNL